jgi:hypothetical protein
VDLGCQFSRRDQRQRNAPHKHVWRAEIVLFSADGVGTNEIMRRTGKLGRLVTNPQSDKRADTAK